MSNKDLQSWSEPLAEFVVRISSTKQRWSIFNMVLSKKMFDFRNYFLSLSASFFTVSTLSLMHAFSFNELKFMCVFILQDVGNQEIWWKTTTEPVSLFIATSQPCRNWHYQPPSVESSTSFSRGKWPSFLWFFFLLMFYANDSFTFFIHFMWMILCFFLGLLTSSQVYLVF